MKLRRLFSILITSYGLVSCCGSYSTAQTPYYLQQDYRNANSNWIFGRNLVDGRADQTKPDHDSAQHIDFNTTPPTVSRKLFWTRQNNPGMRGATLSVSDPEDGKLLFYTEGMHVRNRNQEIMPNGSGLRGDDWLTAQGYYNTVMRQGFCAVPVMGSTTKWYLFTLTSANTNTMRFESKLFYSIIDMELDGGKGDIAPADKNIPLDTVNTMFGEAIVTIPGDNCDIWLLTYDRQTIGYKAFHITEEGINPTPVTSPSISGLDVGAFLQGRLSFSPDRTKISLAYNYNDVILSRPKRGCIVAKFDAATGKVSEEIIITSAAGGYSSAFSDNSKVLYMAGLITTNGNSFLTQYNLSVWDSLSMRQSQYVMDSTSGSGGFGWAIRRKDNQLLLIGGGRVGVIMKPDLLGAACDFRRSYFQTEGITGTKDTVVNAHGLGNDIVLPIASPLLVTTLDTILCSGTALPLMATAIAKGGYVWDDGSTEEVRPVTSPGKYWVSYKKDACNPRADTFIVEEIILDPHITINVNILSTSRSYNTYQWLLNGVPVPGATEKDYLLKENGNYRVIVSGDHGCMDTSEVYSVSSLNISNAAGQNAIKIHPNPANEGIHIISNHKMDASLTTIDGRILRKTTDASYIAIEDLPAGIYLLQLRNKDGSLAQVEKIIKQ